MPPRVPGVIVDLFGFLTGIVLYVMLLALVWRDRSASRGLLVSARGRLPLLTGVFGLIWNVGALISLGLVATGSSTTATSGVGIAFGALGFLPAVVVQSLLESQTTAASPRFHRTAIFTAYGLSAVAALLHVASALRGGPVPSPSALWMLTIGFTALMAALLLVTREQTFGSRGLWIAALSIFAVSALHFERHVGNESWWVELIGHHASLPLALTILYQDYRFALADLFLKRALALLLLVGLSSGAFALVLLPLSEWQSTGDISDPRTIVVIMTLWIMIALAYPALQRVAGWLIDRIVLHRPDYGNALARLAEDLEDADSEAVVLDRIIATLEVSLGVAPICMVASDEAMPTGERRTPGLAVLPPRFDSGRSTIVYLRTVDPPHPAIAVGPLAAGRRLLSDDLQWLEAIGRVATRRIDALRVARERLEHSLRQRETEQLAAEAELRALRAQLHPHFLFNALTTIGYLIQKAPPRALETLLGLTRVLRGVLHRSSSEFSTLGEEVDLIRSYLDIEHARFEERLTIEIDVPAEVRHLTIPTLLLQPLVENALKHGIAHRVAGGIVAIRARAVDAHLSVVVEDSGIGFDAAAATYAGGLGLRNVEERLRVHYGPTARMAIHSVNGRGTTVAIDLPASTRSAAPSGLGRRAS